MRSWRIIFIFVGVFFAGAVAGGFVSLRLASNVSERRMPDDLALRIMERFSQRLELTEAQRQTIRPHVERAAGEMHGMREQTAETIEELHRVVSRELTPAQRETLQGMLAEQRERWKRWSEKREEERRGGGGPHGPRGEPPAGEARPPTPVPAP